MVVGHLINEHTGNIKFQVAFCCHLCFVIAVVKGRQQPSGQDNTIQLLTKRFCALIACHHVS